MVVYVVVERGDVVDGATAPADGKAPVALSIRKGEASRTEAPGVALIDVALGILLVNTPVVGELRAETVGFAGCRSGYAQQAKGIGLCA